MSGARQFAACLGLLAVLWLAPGQVAAQLPAAVQADAPGLVVLGSGTKRFLGLKVYDVKLWTARRPFAHDQAFALELVYDMNLKGADIARRSVDEMRQQGQADEAKLKRWGEEMARIFPDVAPGDVLVGVSLPGQGARFYTRAKFIAAVPDPAFARAFFDIWLSEKTSDPAVRTRLLAGEGR